MNNINFIKTIPPHRHYEIRRWFTVTIMLSSLLIIGIVYVQTMQILRLNEACAAFKKSQNDAQTYTEILNQKNELTKECEILKKKILKAECLTNQQCNLENLLMHVKEICTSSVHLESLQIHKKNVELVAVGPDVQAAFHVADKLNKITYINNVKIISLQHTQDALRFSLTCAITS